MQNLPRHLQKYIVSQNYERYTPVDQACWRFIMRQLKSFLSQHAHQCYVEGLEKTGVEIESIPHIEEISKKLEEFGWRALPVSGFIPPAAFMELQSLSILPIASDMRTVDHLMYTPAPDIVHEAAGHAPILIHPEFASYLKKYALVAKKALISKEDIEMYEAIRKLSDLKESPDSTAEQITKAQQHLDFVSKNISHVSEASELSRMNWWTAEYGLIGELDNPKIFGAGLLSSVGESKWCLSEKVKKIPLTVDCIKTSYDITEPQPQLFVAKNFQDLADVLEKLAQKMAFRVGGLEGIKKAILAQTTNTAELNSGIQISGQFIEVLHHNSQPIYLRCSGPTQLAYQDVELSGHDKQYHAQGFGTVVGFLKQNPNVCPSLFTDEDLKSANIVVGDKVRLEFSSQIIVEGVLKKMIRQDGKIILLTFADALVTYGKRILFEPAWGNFDIAVGSQVNSVFAGPADRFAYGEADDFTAVRVPKHEYTEYEKLLHQQYQEMRDLRNSNSTAAKMRPLLQKLIQTHDDKFPLDWLFQIEALELAKKYLQDSDLTNLLLQKLKDIQRQLPNKKDLIHDGLQLLNE